MSQHEPVLEKYLTVGDYETPGWGPSYVPIHGNQLEKIAGEVYTPASLLKVIQDLKPRPEGRYVLLHALGAYEYWGANRNGDGFPEWSLKSLAPPQEVRSVLDGPVRKACPNFTTPPPSMYGCDTFVKYAHVYRGHANKDPLKACGDVIAAAYNDRMHRVELIVFVYSQRAPDIIDRIDRGAPVAWSMGARLPFDVCSICGNIARTRAHYCRHLAQELGTVYPDGRKVFSYNYFPRFFDISEVGVPADRSAWTLAKVAGLGTGAIPPRRLVVKSASMEKRPDVGGSESLGKAPINPKLLNFIAAAVNRDYDDSVGLPDAQLMAMKRHGLAKSLAAAALMGILLKPDSCMHLLRPGRIVRVHAGEKDWGYGVLLSLKWIEGGNRSDAKQYRADVMLCCVTAAGDKTVLPCSVDSKDGSMIVVPVSLPCLSEVSTLRIQIPADLKDPKAKRSVKSTLKALMAKYPREQLPHLDPLVDFNVSKKDGGRLKGILAEEKTVEADLQAIEAKYGEDITKKLKKAAELQSIARKKEDEAARSPLKTFKEEFRQRKDVLRKLGHIDEEDTVTLKGRAASQIDTGDELLVTELMFDGTFGAMDEHELASLLSCMVPVENSQGSPKLPLRLSNALLRLKVGA